MSTRDEVHMILIGTGEDAFYYTIKTPERVDYFGVPCVRGIGVTPAGTHWIDGSTISVPLSQIGCVVTCVSLADYYAAASRYKAAPGPNQSAPQA